MPLIALWWAIAAQAGLLVVDVLDVGQGDAILVRTDDKAALIDAGVRGAGVADQLAQLGVQRLDLVVATHPHADHIGGMPDVIERYEVGLYIDNGLTHTTRTYEQTMEAVERKGIGYRTAERGTTLHMGDEVVLTILHPAPEALRGTRSDLNSNSVVLRLDHGDVSFLFTGDAEEPTEEALLGYGLSEVDVLKVAHHGSAHASTRAFLDVVSPQIALISCGADNRYGHPAPENLERLAEAGAMVYRTDLSGQLRVVSDGSTVEVFEGSLAELERIAVYLAPGAVRSAPPDPPDPPAPPVEPRPQVAEVEPQQPIPQLSRREQRRQRREAKRAARKARKEAR